MTPINLTKIAPLPGSRCALGGAPFHDPEPAAPVVRKRRPLLTPQITTRAQAVARAMSALDKALTSLLPTAAAAGDALQSSTRQVPVDPIDEEVRIEVGPLSAVCPCAICGGLRDRAREGILARRSSSEKDALWRKVFGAQEARGIRAPAIMAADLGMAYNGPPVEALGLDSAKVSGVVLRTRADARALVMDQLLAVTAVPDIGELVRITTP